MLGVFGLPFEDIPGVPKDLILEALIKEYTKKLDLNWRDRL
jgi:hypothetical protein